MGEHPRGLAQLKGDSCKDPGHRRPGAGWAGSRTVLQLQGDTGRRASFLRGPTGHAAREEPRGGYLPIPPYSPTLPSLESPAPRAHKTLALKDAFLPAQQ